MYIFMYDRRCSPFSLKRKRQLEFTGEKAGTEETPPLPSFPDEILEEHAKKARKESTPETGILLTLCKYMERELIAA